MAGSARNQGNQADFVLGTAEGWDAFGVVRLHGVEELSELYRYEITLQRQASNGAVDLDKLLDTGASLRMASLNRWRIVHGIVAEAEEIDRTGQLILYRVVLCPHIWRARYRRHSRNFLDRSLVEIISAVLENRSPAHPEGMGGLSRFTSAAAPDEHPSFSSFSPPKATYRWDLKDSARSENRTTRPYVVQYNESDLDFIQRLLEDEGLTYYFEHGQDEVVLTITDQPGVSPMFDDGSTFTMRRVSTAGTSQQQEIVRSLRDTRRLRSRAVMVRDWDYLRSAAPLEATNEDPALDPELSRHYEFPVGEEAVKAQPGQHAATVRKQRYDAERAMREGSSNVRTMVPGYRFTLHDDDGINQDAKLLATRVELYATELAPQGTILDEELWGFAQMPGALAAGYDSRFLALDEAVPFRPAMRTPRPRIHGVQAAVVTAEEYPDGERPTVNGDELGRVRVRFPWDQRADVGDKTPTSRWIRVSQYWAGAGYGALYLPRVGHEVLVAFMEGDPDQPVIVGRVYNAQHTPPYDAKKEPAKSTIKSQSTEVTKEVDGYNEIRFDDRAKKEEIFIHAQRNLNEVVLASHSTSVGGDQSNFVGHDQTNTVKGHRIHTVEDFETVTVVSDRTTIFQANEHHSVASFRDTTIGANDDLNVGGWHNVKVGGGETFTVKAKRDVFVGDNQTYVIGANFESTAAGHHSFKSMNGYWTLSNDFQVNSATAGFNQRASYYVHAGSSIVLQAGSAKLSMTSGVVTIDNGAGASITLLGAMVMVNAGSAIVATAGGPVSIVAGGKMGLASGGAMALGAGGDIDAKAPNIHLNG